MRSAGFVWVAIGVLYLVFLGWYTPWGGPLGPEEIERYLTLLRERGADAERLATFRRFMETDTGDDFVMLNAIDMREQPLAVEGVTPGETSAEVLARYTRPFLGRALRSAAHPVFLGTAAAPAMDLWGIEGAEEWSTAGLVRYRSRRDLLEQAVRTGGDGIHAFKIAAMEKTIAFPVDPYFHLGEPRFVLALVLGVVGLGWHLRCTRVDLRRARRHVPA